MRWNLSLQLFEPVLDDVNLARRCCFFQCLDHQKALAII